MTNDDHDKDIIKIILTFASMVNKKKQYYIIFKVSNIKIRFCTMHII
jgi:hypothetical protein